MKTRTGIAVLLLLLVAIGCSSAEPTEPTRLVCDVTPGSAPAVSVTYPIQPDGSVASEQIVEVDDVLRVGFDYSPDDVFGYTLEIVVRDVSESTFPGNLSTSSLRGIAPASTGEVISDHSNLHAGTRTHYRVRCVSA